MEAEETKIFVKKKSHCSKATSWWLIPGSH